eukprot:1154291-Pelagomonas_calceolata.AAC.10
MLRLHVLCYLQDQHQQNPVWSTCISKLWDSSWHFEWRLVGCISMVVPHFGSTLKSLLASNFCQAPKTSVCGDGSKSASLQAHLIAIYKECCLPATSRPSPPVPPVIATPAAPLPPPPPPSCTPARVMLLLPWLGSREGDTTTCMASKKGFFKEERKDGAGATRLGTCQGIWRRASAHTRLLA